jgi:hypothetical protein
MRRRGRKQYRLSSTRTSAIAVMSALMRAHKDQSDPACAPALGAVAHGAAGCPNMAQPERQKSSTLSY